MQPEKISRTLRASVFSPTWLPAPWNKPPVGYTFAVFLPSAMILFTWFVLQHFPTFALKGIFAQSTTLVVALLWGTGPGLVAILLSALLLNVVLLPPHFALTLSSPQTILETGAFLTFGLAICLVVSRIEYARSEAERARQRVEQLAHQLEQEKAQVARQAGELEAVFAAIADGVYVYDAHGRVKRANPAGQAFNPHTSQDDYLQQPFPEHITLFQPRDGEGQPFATEDLPVMRVLRGKVLTGAQAVDTLMRTMEGEDRLYNVSGAPLYDEEGHVSGAVVVTRDLTEQHRSTQRTREALQALLHFAEALVQAGTMEGPAASEEKQEPHEAVVEVDQVANRLAALMSQVLAYPHVSLTTFKESTREPAARATVGLSAEQERGWRQRQRGYTVHELIAGTVIERRLNAGEAVVLDLNKPPFSALPRAYGPRKFLLVPMSLEGRDVGVVTFDAGDPSHEYSDEEVSLARALAQLAALTLERTRLFQERAQAQATVLALSEANGLMDEFIGIAGHELRTPLTTIQGSVQLARRQVSKILKQQENLSATVIPLVTSVGDHLERTERQIRMQNRLISDLLDVARIHTNRLELHPELCDLVVLVRESVEDQCYLTPNRTITFTGKVSEEVLVMADTDRLRQVLSNYLSNALKYSEADKPVEVHLETLGKLVRLAVRDEGPGLSRQEQQRIWDRFYRVPGVEVKSGSGVGLGLGLHISRMIVERLGGQVGVQSVPGSGSTFWFTLPLVETSEEE